MICKMGIRFRTQLPYLWARHLQCTNKGLWLVPRVLPTCLAWYAMFIGRQAKSPMLWWGPPPRYWETNYMSLGEGYCREHGHS